jgi:predicted esterase
MGMQQTVYWAVIYQNRYMKPNLSKLILVVLTVFTSLIVHAQLLPLSAANANQLVSRLQGNTTISADGLLKTIRDWQGYPVIAKTDMDYKYVYTDTLFGKIPLRVFIPTSYKSSVKTPCVLLLHGAVSRSRFTDVDSLAQFNDDVLFAELKKHNYIIVRPVADRDVSFDWGKKAINGKGRNLPNYTFSTLNVIMVSLKKVLNIDDSKVFAMGHSDGSDGAIGFGVYSPGMFAGIVAYNAMMNQLFVTDFYIKNIIDRPLYIVHSDLDVLRPMVQTRNLVNQLKALGAQKIRYKEYFGYTHQDKHLDIDLPFAVKFMDSVKRDSFQSRIYWETSSDTIFNHCDWLRITQSDFAKQTGAWYKQFNTRQYDKINKRDMEMNYYDLDENRMAVEASYAKNTFNLQTSRVKQVEVLISPAMVDMAKPVIINVDGRQVFKGIVKPDKAFILEHFKNDFDRDANWVASVKVKVE